MVSISFLHSAFLARMLASISPSVIKSADNIASSSSDRQSESLQAMDESKNKFEQLFMAVTEKSFI